MPQGGLSTQKADRNMKAEFVWERKEQAYALRRAVSTHFLTLLHFSGITQLRPVSGRNERQSQGPVTSAFVTVAALFPGVVA